MKEKYKSILKIEIPSSGERDFIFISNEDKSIHSLAFCDNDLNEIMGESFKKYMNVNIVVDPDSNSIEGIEFLDEAKNQNW